ncbi:MAG: DUF2095 domain-containing protein [Asgard group archaeon]|nr:DUF2095 domain-containing protein [Asgard group archaeon]
MVKILSKELDEFPTLKKEIKEKKKVVSLQYVDDETANLIEDELTIDANVIEDLNPSISRLAGFDPTAIDFIRRCDTEEQAKEIIDFLEQKGDVDSIEAKKLRNQLTAKGLRSFGPKKEKGHYFNQQD